MANCWRASRNSPISGKLIVQEQADEAVQPARVGHVHPHRFFTVLEQHGEAGVFEQDVIAWVAAVELF